MRLYRLTLATLIALAGASEVPAQLQSREQQKCLNAVVKQAIKVSSTVVKGGGKCLARDPAGEGTDACITDTGAKKRVKARASVDSTVNKLCSVPPTFGFTAPATINAAHEDEAEATFEDSLGAEINTTLASNVALDPRAACSASVSKGQRKLLDTMQKEWARCLKSGLKDGSVGGADGLSDCLDAMAADDRGKISKQAAKLTQLLDKRCPASDLAVLLPGLDTVCAAYGEEINAAGFGSCLELRSRCRVCRTLQSANDFLRGCDDLDDSVVNGTCPECPNGVVESGEECDDGNFDDGDGCTVACIQEYCGDGIVNNSGSEQCDDGENNSDATPDACRTNCELPSCGDGVTDSGEQCDDGNLDESDGCTTACTICGDGVVTPPEQCDDGNLDDGDCCASSCTTAPDGTSCPAPDECTKTAECAVGVCTPVIQVVTGDACQFAVVGESAVDTVIRTENQASVDGPWCGSQGDFGQGTVIRDQGDVVVTEDDGLGVGILFAASVNVDSGDILTNGSQVQGRDGVDVPGLTAVNAVSAGQTLAKEPSPTFYDTTGADPRVQLCIDAQASLTQLAVQLDALSATQNLTTTYEGISGGSTLSLPPDPLSVVPGGLNVYDLTNITGGNDVTLNLHGGSDPDTVVIVRVDDRIDSDLRWQFNLVDGLQPQNVIFYSKSTSLFRCELGEDNVFNGTLFCPNTRTDVKLRTVVNGAIYGGGGGGIGRLLLGELTELNHIAFTGL